MMAELQWYDLVLKNSYRGRAAHVLLLLGFGNPAATRKGELFDEAKCYALISTPHITDEFGYEDLRNCLREFSFPQNATPYV